MKRTILALALLAPLSGCRLLGWVATPTHSIDAAAAGPIILDVCDQHDESVARDPELVPAEKEQALRSSATLREIVRASGAVTE